MSFTNKSKDMRYTPTPNIIFGELLEQIDNINDLKFILRIIWMLNQVKRVPKYITIKEMISDKILYSLICNKPGTEIESNAISMTEKPNCQNILISCKIDETGSTSTIVALNTSRNKTMLSKIKEIDKSNTLFQPPGNTSEQSSSNIFKLYEDNIGMLNPIIADELKAAEKTYPDKWIASAFKESVIRNKRSWKYIKTILENWYREGKTDGRIGENTKKSGYNQYFRRQ